MLKKDFVAAAREGKFRVYAVDTVGEALELVTGLPVGERQEDGSYPDGTFNFLVDKRLREMSKKLKVEDKGEDS
jgi:predicted ATP-dependent protease